MRRAWQEQWMLMMNRLMGAADFYDSLAKGSFLADEAFIRDFRASLVTAGRTRDGTR